MVNGKSLRNNDVEINNNLVVHNGLEAGDGILSATQNAVEVKLKPAASTESKDIPSKTHGIVASNDGYAAVGYAGNQVGFNSENVLAESSLTSFSFLSIDAIYAKKLF